MPIYEYECHRCNATEEFSMSLGEYESFEAVCSDCGSMDLRRKWAAPAIHVDHAE